jgi:hypothetical protein
MKTVRIFTLVMAVAMLSSFTVDGKNKPESPESELREKITKLIRKPDLKLIPIHEREVTVEFIITRENKLVVLDVDTYNEPLKKYIKQKLNYHKVAVDGVRKLMPYRIDLTFVVRP